MVIFVLDHPGRQPGELFVVRLEILVQITHPDRKRTPHALVQSRQRKTSLFVEFRLLGNFVNFGINERTPVIGQFGMVFAPRRAVHDEQADAFTDLGSRKPYALGLLEREEHILDQLFNFGIVGSDLPAFFAQYRRPENNYRINHNFFPFLTRPQPEN